jgi:hypothetical protein
MIRPQPPRMRKRALGRFDWEVKIQWPASIGRERIIRVMHAARVDLGAGIEIATAFFCPTSTTSRLPRDAGVEKISLQHRSICPLRDTRGIQPFCSRSCVRAAINAAYATGKISHMRREHHSLPGRYNTREQPIAEDDNEPSIDRNRCGCPDTCRDQHRFGADHHRRRGGLCAAGIRHRSGSARLLRARGDRVGTARVR